MFTKALLIAVSAAMTLSLKDGDCENTNKDENGWSIGDRDGDTCD